MKNIIYFGSASRLRTYFEKRGAEGAHIQIDYTLSSTPEEVESFFGASSYIPPPHKAGEEIWAILVAGNAINFGVLSVLERFKDCSISIYYLIPDLTFESELVKQTHKIVYNVLQEYSRSGKFLKMVLFDLQECEKMFDTITFINYDDIVLDTIAYAILTNSQLGELDAKISTKKEEDPAARIETLGLLDISKGEAKLFFPLQHCREIIYKYLVGEQLKSNKFRKDILEFLKNKYKDETKIIYEIFEAEGQNICLMVLRSAVIQT